MNTPMLAIGPLGTTEMIIIAILVLVLFGAKKLPTFARSLGRSAGEFRRAKEEFETELHRAGEEVEKSVKPANKTIPVERQRDHEDA
jgi:sec-independent protein translocase protein TatA